MANEVGAVELRWAGSLAAPASQRSRDYVPGGRIHGDHMGSKDSTDARWRSGKGKRIRGQDTALDRADVKRVRRIAVKHAQSRAVIVRERRVRLQRCRPRSREGARCGRKGIHDGAPNGGMTETEEMAE